MKMQNNTKKIKIENLRNVMEPMSPVRICKDNCKTTFHDGRERPLKIAL